jgi:hypothetical protein
MADESALKKHLEDFQKAVKKLGDSVNKSGVEWNDAQFISLSNSIKGVAASSKQVLVFGNQCSSAIKRFNAIESER